MDLRLNAHGIKPRAISELNNSIVGEIMHTIHKPAMVAVFAVSAFACVTIAGSSVRAGPIVPPGHYCMTWDTGGSDCSFTSYAQCQATASGIDAECYGKTLRDDEESRIQSRRGYNSRAQAR
jgi:hypothetical protein